MNTEAAKSRKPKKEKELVKITPAFIVFFSVVFVCLTIHCISLIYPVVWVFNNSLKTKLDAVACEMAV